MLLYELHPAHAFLAVCSNLHHLCQQQDFLLRSVSGEGKKCHLDQRVSGHERDNLSLRLCVCIELDSISSVAVSPQTHSVILYRDSVVTGS